VCVVCVTIAGTLLAASQLTPVEMLSEPKTQQRTLAAYSGSTVSLSSKQKSEIRSLVRNAPGGDSVTCVGNVSKGASKAAVGLARTRAKSACDFAMSINSNLNASVLTRTTTNKSSIGRVTVSIKSNSSNKLPVTPAPDPDSIYPVNELSLDPNICKIKEDSRMRKPSDSIVDYSNELEIRGRYTGNATAFPFNPTTLPAKGKLDVALVFVDWPDLPGTPQDYEFYREQIKLFEDFYWMVSENKLDMNVVVSSKWYRIRDSYLNYTLAPDEEAQRGEAPRKQIFYDAAVAASDPEFDYSSIEIVYFAIPRSKSVFFLGGPHEFNFDWNGYLKTSERKIYDTASAGDFFLTNPGQPPWVYYVHETGHMIGIPHQANEDQNKPNTEKYLVTPLGGYDIMSNQGGATRTITSWLRWLAGWLNDDQVVCVTKEAISLSYYKLHPINEVKGRKESLVIKLSETKAIVVESRRYDKNFDVDSGNSKNGILVYTVDATKASAQGNQILLSPRDITKYLREQNTFPDWRELDAMFFKGDSVTYDGVKIEVISSGADYDIVRVTK
jgi:M6 family metalloprotease-like protein